MQAPDPGRSGISPEPSWLHDKNYPHCAPVGQQLTGVCQKRLAKRSFRPYIGKELITEKMKTYYQITAEGIGIVLLRKRKIAKALRRWLRDKGLSYEYVFYIQ